MTLTCSLNVIFKFTVYINYVSQTLLMFRNLIQSDRELEIANRMRDGALVRAQRATINKDLADATITRDVKKLKPMISKAEKKRVNGTENYLLQAKKLYEQLQAATQLQGATFDRRIADIESAIHAIKKGGFETLLAVELLEAQVNSICSCCRY